MFWTDPAHDAFLLERSGVLTTPEIAEAFNRQFGLNISRDQVKGRIQRLKQSGASSPIYFTPEERFEAAVGVEKVRAADRALAREMTAAVRQQARWDEFLDIVRGEIARMPAFEAPSSHQMLKAAGCSCWALAEDGYHAPDCPLVPSSLAVPQHLSQTPETMVLLLSDIHVGKLVQPSVVGDEFGYNAAIFEERLARLKDRVLKIRSLHYVDRLVVYFLGDGVDGVDMRRGHAHRVDLQTATQQTIVLSTALSRLFAELATVFPRVDVQWHFGNHGRIGDFGVNLPSDNHDWMAGMFVQTILEASPNITVKVPTQKYSLTQLGPLTVYAAHGDGIKGGGGFAGLPIYGIARSVAKEIGLHKQNIDLALFGHFHTPYDMVFGATRVIGNSDWSGGDDFSINALGLASEPSQTVFGIHPRRGLTWMYQINLTDGPRRPTKVN